ncbi:hypothetical protein [Kaarinaea lacus]
MNFSQPTIITLYCMAFTLLLVTAPPLFAAPELQTDSELATAGYYRLSWQNNIAADFVLEEATDPTFSQVTILYQGPDTATLISGRSDGTYYYRIRNMQDDIETEWSNVTRVEVSHHPLSRAFMFFGLGAFVFIATLVIVLLGSKTDNQ